MSFADALRHQTAKIIHADKPCQILYDMAGQALRINSAPYLAADIMMCLMPTITQEVSDLNIRGDCHILRASSRRGGERLTIVGYDLFEKHVIIHSGVASWHLPVFLHYDHLTVPLIPYIDDSFHWSSTPRCIAKLFRKPTPAPPIPVPCKVKLIDGMKYFPVVVNSKGQAVPWRSFSTLIIGEVTVTDIGCLYDAESSTYRPMFATENDGVYCAESDLNNPIFESWEGRS